MHPWKKSSGFCSGRILGSSQNGTPQLLGPTAAFSALRTRAGYRQLCAKGNLPTVQPNQQGHTDPSLKVGVGGVMVHGRAEDAAQRARSGQHLALVQRHLVLVVGVAPATGPPTRVTCTLLTADMLS